MNDINFLRLRSQCRVTKKQKAVTALIFILNLLDVYIEERDKIKALKNSIFKIFNFNNNTVSKCSFLSQWSGIS